MPGGAHGTAVASLSSPLLAYHALSITCALGTVLFGCTINKHLSLTTMRWYLALTSTVHVSSSGVHDRFSLDSYLHLNFRYAIGLDCLNI